jgi:hypothetical protein
LGCVPPSVGLGGAFGADGLIEPPIDIWEASMDQRVLAACALSPRFCLHRHALPPPASRAGPGVPLVRRRSPADGGAVRGGRRDRRSRDLVAADEALSWHGHDWWPSALRHRRREECPAGPPVSCGASWASGPGARLVVDRDACFESGTFNRTPPPLRWGPRRRERRNVAWPRRNLAAEPCESYGWGAAVAAI